MRGEFKVRGGKLVSVDVEASDEKIASVHVFGDFFLEPDDALEDINAALVGMPVEATAAELGAAITARLDARPEPVQMIGFDAEAVAIAVRRALGHANSWDELTFDVFEPAVMEPVMHVALDEVLPLEVAAGRRPPLFRIWDWDSPLVVIGSYQSLRNEIDAEGAQKHGIGVVRRITGGGAMFMEPGNCLTYSLVVPTSLVEGLSFEQAYAYLDDWVMGALAEIGVKARYVPLNDIASEQGKIGGAAQRRFAGGVLLHHVTMAYDIDADKMGEVLRIGREKLSDKGTRSANKRVDPMRSQTGLAREQIIDGFLDHFRGHYDTRPATYTDAELARARELVETKFGTEEWTARVP
ncbi:lipoate--protein ligase family protein [Brachybacterium muris]|uniref:lipoate--protein ligase family protein n=1 Tax=Brachybacterium muris TaxID=219301 RepID=UPI00223B99FB|nr:lipoate--protein ligase family protein [Brachybacterium muris]MCT2178005.1 lipoate--protein ligase family protein [Brachybacterium muris]MCT2261920.1 lipoate--protein ligase family protein [Brachybacterium muris]